MRAEVVAKRDKEANVWKGLFLIFGGAFYARVALNAEFM